MVNELCELAASGMDAKKIGIVGVALIALGILFFVLNKKRVLRARWLLPVLLFLFIIGSPTQYTAFAQDANNNCVSEQNDGQDPGTPEAIGGLVDDNPELAYDEDFGEYYATFSVLPNDNAPNGDSFDISTIQLLGEFPDPEYQQYTYLILDPNNPTPPTTPSSPDNPDWANVWGTWSLELTCDPDDTDHCGTNFDDSLYCIDASAGTCWPTGVVNVYFNNLAEPGTYSIQYTVNTQSGIPLIPATITVTVPEVVVPSPITSYSVDGFSNACDVWPNDFSLDLMDGSFFSTTGPGTLLANSIDLDPGTPGQQTTITIYAEDSAENYVTYTVNNAGILTMTTPQSEFEGFNTYILDITIQDSNGFAPDAPASYTRYPGCG